MVQPPAPVGQFNDLLGQLQVGLRTVRRASPTVAHRDHHHGAGTTLADRGCLQHLAQRVLLDWWAQSFAPEATFSVDTDRKLTSKAGWSRFGRRAQ